MAVNFKHGLCLIWLKTKKKDLLMIELKIKGIQIVQGQ